MELRVEAEICSISTTVVCATLTSLSSSCFSTMRVKQLDEMLHCLITKDLGCHLVVQEFLNPSRGPIKGFDFNHEFCFPTRVEGESFPLDNLH